MRGHKRGMPGCGLGTTRLFYNMFPFSTALLPDFLHTDSFVQFY